MVKKILFGLLAAIVLLIIVGFFLPGKIEVTRSISINAPGDYVFEEVDVLKNWGRWSYWNTLDTTMKVTYNEQPKGVGAAYSWESKDMGNGKLNITESIPNSSIKADLDFMEQGTAKAWYNFEPDGEGTKVTMGFSTEFGMNPIGRWMGALFIKSEMNKAFDYNLNKLKELAEAKPKFNVAISEESVGPMTYIGLKHTMSPKDPKAISTQMEKMYTELFTALTKAKAQPSGQPFCIYPKFSEESMDMICALPVADGTKVPAKYPIMTGPGGRAVKAIHKGDYVNLEDTHNQINQYIEFRNLEINGAPWEVYVTDPTVEKDPANWVTEVYYPVKEK